MKALKDAWEWLMASIHSGGKGPGKKAKDRAEDLDPPATLNALTGTFTLAEDAAQGASAGSLSDMTTGSTLSLAATAGGRVALAGTSIVRGATALDYEAATSHSFTVRETLFGASNSPRDTVFSLTVTDVSDDATAPTITSADPSGTYDEGDAIGGTLTADESVTWTVTGTDAAAVTLNASTGAWSLEATDYETQASYSFTFTATDASDNEGTQAVSITIADVEEDEEAGELSTPDVTVTSAAGAVPEVDIGVNDDHFAGYYLDVQQSATEDFASPILDITHQLQPSNFPPASEPITNADLSGYSDPTGTYWQRYRIRREDGAISAWVTITDTIA